MRTDRNSSHFWLYASLYEICFRTAETCDIHFINKISTVKSRSGNTSLIQKNRYTPAGNARITLPGYVDPRLYLISFNCKICSILAKSIPPGYNIITEKSIICKSADLKVENPRSLNK